ncbi:hypothetical protein Xets_03879 [Xenorhabdus sp. TS4]|nr:hypothetical protein [Xenorhabdus sp. TS4]
MEPLLLSDFKTNAAVQEQDTPHIAEYAVLYIFGGSGLEPHDGESPPRVTNVNFDLIKCNLINMRSFYEYME